MINFVIVLLIFNPFNYANKCILKIKKDKIFIFIERKDFLKKENLLLTINNTSTKKSIFSKWCSYTVKKYKNNLSNEVKPRARSPTKENVFLFF